MSRLTCLRMFFADSKFGELAASTRVYSSTACSEDDRVLGKTTSAKKPVTIRSKRAITPSMMANSLENIERRHRGFHSRSIIAASNEEVTDPAHSTNKNRLFGIIA